MTTDIWVWLVAGLVVLVLIPVGFETVGGLRRRCHVEGRVLPLRDPLVLARPVRPPWSAYQRSVDRWLAEDGPTPTAGWWHNGGLVVDLLGASLLDAAGLRHALPAEVATLCRTTAPRGLLLLDARDRIVARLPTGFAEDDLRRVCAAAGWEFRGAAGPSGEAAKVLDLRRAVVDRAARDGGLAARLGAAVRRNSAA